MLYHILDVLLYHRAFYDIIEHRLINDRSALETLLADIVDKLHTSYLAQIAVTE